jgi:hypothetical protein
VNFSKEKFSFSFSASGRGEKMAKLARIRLLQRGPYLPFRMLNVGFDLSWPPSPTNVRIAEPNISPSG